MNSSGVEIRWRLGDNYILVTPNNTKPIELRLASHDTAKLLEKLIEHVYDKGRVDVLKRLSEFVAEEAAT